jgi:glycerol-3-phosphate O-acyltransferase / dihydroxyacetone phosphate acyltransferase
MIYALLRAIAGLALRWYYSGLDVEGLERVPRDAPVLLVVNHPNALVDALVVGWTFPRRLVLTAKATLFANPALAWLLRTVGVVPLIRAKDEGAAGGAPDPRRNEGAFRAVHDALRQGRAALIFPEGISHDEPYLAPLRTGAARIALEGVRVAGIRGLVIVPVGLNFERKERLRSRILVQVGEPIGMDRWTPDDESAAVDELTAEIDARLRAVTLNYASADDAARARALASSLARLIEDTPEVGAADSLRNEVVIARRIDEARVALQGADEATRERVDVLLTRLSAFERSLAREDVALDDVAISSALVPGARFVAREGWRVVVGGPVAAWGRINHWIPFHLARAVAMRSVESAADPAMRTIVATTTLVVVFYLFQGALVWHWIGPIGALLYLMSLPLAADISFALRDRLSRVRQRARAYLRFRRDPALQRRLIEELQWLREEALALDEQLRRVTTR